MYDKIARPDEIRGDNIGIMGMTVDPPHRGHLETVRGVLTLNRFSTLIVYPTGEQRDDKVIIAGPNDRAAMLMQTFSLELFRHHTKLLVICADMYGTNTYTINLLRAYKRRYPDKRITWITGSDSDISTWHCGKELLACWNFCIVPRPGYPRLNRVVPKYHEVLDVPHALHVSSSQMKRLIAEGKPFEHLVTDGVAKWIKEYGLYGYK